MKCTTCGIFLYLIWHLRLCIQHPGWNPKKTRVTSFIFHTKPVCWSCEIVQEVDSRYQTSGIIVLMEGCVHDDDDDGVHYHLTHVTSAPPSSQRYTFFCKTVLVYSKKKKRNWFEICNNKRKIIHNCAVMTDFKIVLLK